MDPTLWVSYALKEGLGMGLMKIGQGYVGAQSPTLWHLVLATGLVGLVMTVVGFLVLLYAKEKFYPGGGYLIGSLLSGVAMFGATFCAFAALRAGADMGANTFLGNAIVIVPAAIIGRLRFKEKVGLSQWLGIVVAIASAVCVTMPTLDRGGGWAWIVWSLGTLAFATFMRLFPKELAVWGRRHGLPPIHSGQQLFWGGVAMTFCIVVASSQEGPAQDVFRPEPLLLIGAVGISNVFWWRYRLLAYIAKAPMSVKDLPTLPVYLATASLGGCLLFGDTFGLWKAFGFFLFFPAFFLAQEGSWGYCKRLLGEYRWRIRSPIYLDRCTEQPEPAQPRVRVG